MAGIAGSVSPVFRDGGYDETTIYDFYHAIIYNNKLYFCRQDGTIGHEPQEESDEYWFLSLDGNFADSAMLGGETAEQWQEKITNIINGTTPAGNALKLNGLTAEEFVKGVSPHFASGETILDWATNPNGIYKKFIVDGVYPSDAPIQQEGFCELSIDGSRHRKQVKFTPYRINKYPIYERSFFQGAWNTEWTKPNDGGNADTVGGYRASDFIHLTNGKVAGITKFDTVHMVSKGGMEGGEIQFAVPETGHSFDSTMVTQDVYGDLVRFFATHDGVTKGFYIDFRTLGYNSEAIHSNNIGNHALPLTGGTVGDGIKDNPIWFRGNAEHVWTTYGLADGRIVGFIGINSEGKLQFDDTKVGRKDILHTGNSLKVQASNDAPTDANTMWYDTANKTWKRYVDGAWQA